MHNPIHIPVSVYSILWPWACADQMQDTPVGSSLLLRYLTRKPGLVPHTLTTWPTWQLHSGASLKEYYMITLTVLYSRNCVVCFNWRKSIFLQAFFVRHGGGECLTTRGGCSSITQLSSEYLHHDTTHPNALCGPRTNLERLHYTSMYAYQV